MKLKLIAAALAFAATGNAFAITAADDVSSGNSFLLLTVLDSSYNGGVGRAYIRSLEVGMNDFGTMNQLAAFPGSIRDDGVNNADGQTWSGGAAWTSFVTGVSDVNALTWDVTALDSNGTSALNQKRVLTTSNTNLQTAVANAGVLFNNNSITLAGTNQDVYWDAAIAALGNGTEVVVDDGASNAFAIGAGKHSNNLGGQITAINTMTNIGDADGMGFYYLTRSSASNTAEAVAKAYGDGADLDYRFSLASNGTLTYAAPVAAPVPEADTYALMLAGLGLVGFLARRRKV